MGRAACRVCESGDTVYGVLGGLLDIDLGLGLCLCGCSLSLGLRVSLSVSRLCLCRFLATFRC